jgi:CubicO group peptidase (beta-lactamase class C family)
LHLAFRSIPTDSVTAGLWKIGFFDDETTVVRMLLSVPSTDDAVGAIREATEDRRENGLSTGHQIGDSEPQRMNILDRMAFHHIPGATVAVIHAGKIAWVGAYGVRQTDGPKVNSSTLFDVGSISKPVTAMGVLRLVQDGKIDLDSDVNLYLKRWKVGQNQWTLQKSVTVRMLLNHTGGFGDSRGKVYKPSETPTLLQQLNGQPPAANAPVQVVMLPGSRFEYSNNGYLVLQLLVEDVAGKPFAEAMQRLVLKPLGMQHSTFAVPLSADAAKNAASAFGGRQKIGMPAEQFVIPNLAAGGLWSNAEDLAKVAIEIQAAYSVKHSKVLNQKSAQWMLTPGAGFPLEAQGAMYRGHEHWGLGIELAGQPEHPFFDHGGAAIYDSYMLMYMSGDGIVVTTNDTHGFSLTYELLQSAASVYGWPDFGIERRPAYDLSVAETDKFIGEYGVGIHVLRSTQGLVFRFDQQEQTARMIPWSATQFFLEGLSEELTFHIDPHTHEVLSLDVDDMQASFTVKKAVHSPAN